MYLFNHNIELMSLCLLLCIIILLIFCPLNFQFSLFVNKFQFMNKELIH